MSAVKTKVRPSGMDGTWIDFTIVNGLGLTDQEKILFSMIFNLSKRKEGCTAGNAYFAEIMEKSEKAISEAISRMVRKGVIKIRLTKTKFGTSRVMFANVKVQKPTPQLTPEATPQKDEPTPQIVVNDPQIMEATPHRVECMHSTEYGTNIKGIKKDHNKEIEKGSLSQTNTLTWLNVRDKAKDLILREWGEYDHLPENEKTKVELFEKYQEGTRPEIVLEMIQKLIAIRKSEKFIDDTFWQSRPVNISTAYSYKDHIKNAYNAVLLLAETKPRKFQTENSTHVLKERNPINIRTDYSRYDSFETWASTKLTASSVDMIRKVQNPLELPHSIKMIYDKFVLEEGGTPVLHSPKAKVAV